MLRQKKFTDLIGQLASKNYKSHDLELQENNRPSFKNYDEYLTQLVANLGGRTGLIYDLVLKEPIRETHIDISSETRSRKTVVATISSQISIGQNPSPTASPQVTSANDGAASGTYKELTVDQEPYSGSANNDLYLSYEPDNYCIVRANENISDDAWQKARLFELDAALAGHNELDKPDIITFGELAYPPPRTNSASKEQVQTRQNSFQNEVTKRLKKYEQSRSEKQHLPFVFLGSYHCPVNKFNTGIFYPDANPIDASGQVKFREFRQKESLSKKARKDINQLKAIKEGIEKSETLPLSHLKRFPARRAEEELRVPVGHEFTIYKTAHGKIAILICSDVLDLNQFLFLANDRITGDVSKRVDLVIVPSWNTSEKLTSMCRELSVMGSTIVVNINANYHSSDFPDTRYFVCGLEAVPDNDNPHIGVRYRSNYVKRKFGETEKEAEINWFEIDWKSLNSVRDNMNKTLFRAGYTNRPIGKEVEF